MIGDCIFEIFPATGFRRPRVTEIGLMSFLRNQAWSKSDGAVVSSGQLCASCEDSVVSCVCSPDSAASTVPEMILAGS